MKLVILIHIQKKPTTCGTTVKLSPQRGGHVIETLTLTLHFNKKIWDRTEVVVITRWSLYRGCCQLEFYCILLDDISDQLPVLTTIEKVKILKNYSTLYMRDTRNFDAEVFLI